MKRLFLIILVVFSLSVVAKDNVNTKPYPFGNPVIKHMYTADASPHVMPDGRVWMVTSVDHENGGGYSTMHKYHTFSSSDMVNWIDHGEVLNIHDVLGKDIEPEGEDWALWAPDMIYYRGLYYLYFPVRILFKSHGYEENKRKTTSYIAVAVSNAPDKRFKVINPKIEGTRGIDPSVFIDDDGKKYLYFGAHWGAELEDNMKELKGKPIRMEVDDDHFMEAIWMNKRNGKYYVSYHTHYEKPIDPENPNDESRLKSRLDYGVSDKPLGPFEYKGIMNHELGYNVKEGPRVEGQDYVPWRLFQSNHGGIVEFHGKEYLFYHTSALSSWRQDAFKGPGTWTQRSVCIDYLNYDEEGSIIPVEQTLTSVNPVVINQPYEKILEKDEMVICRSKTMMYKSIDLGTGYYYFGIDLKNSKVKGNIEIRMDAADGTLLGTILLKNGQEINEIGKAETFLRNAKGKHDIFLVINIKGGDNIRMKNVRFFAGCPLNR